MTSELGGGTRTRALTIGEQQIWTIVCVVLLLISSTLSLRHLVGTQPLLAAVAVLVSTALVAGGLYMTSGGRARWTGLAVALTGAIWTFDWWPLGSVSGPGAVIAWLCGGARWIALVYVGLTYPSDLPRGKGARNILWASVVLFGPGNFCLVLLSRPEWNGFDPGFWWPHLDVPREVFDVATAIYALGILVLTVCGVTVVTRRLRTAGGVDRLVITPSVYGLMVAGAVGASAKVFQSVLLTETAWKIHVLATGLGMLAIPGSQVWSSLKFWVARSSVVETITRLSRPATPEAVREALATALHDESIEVYLWSDERQGIIPGPVAGGRPQWADRAVIPVLNPDRTPLAYITTDPRLEVYPEMLEAAVSAARLPLENARMNADLRVALTETRESRTRIYEAQVAERRRLERDLHDGVQQRMLALALRLEQLRVGTGEKATQELALTIKNDLQSTLEEIRGLSRGLHPAALQQGGLVAALSIVASSLSLRARFDVVLPDLTPTHESAVYFIVCEALANVSKYAHTDACDVTARATGRVIRIEIEDAGSGGAVLSPTGGLRGISDRVAALGGTLEVRSPQGAGTMIDVSFPLPA